MVVITSKTKLIMKVSSDSEKSRVFGFPCVNRTMIIERYWKSPEWLEIIVIIIIAVIKIIVFHSTRETMVWNSTGPPSYCHSLTISRIDRALAPRSADIGRCNFSLEIRI